MPLQQLFLSTSDAKPRLKWTPELHLMFVRAVDRVGGVKKATPKSLMKAMGIRGLTLYHLKSHLQKYRLGRNQQAQFNKQRKLQDDVGNRRNNADKICMEASENRNPPIVEALLVQRKLREQIEVQKHLQLRIEAQGKYLQTVLKKAQATLSNLVSCSIEVENACDHLAELASLVDSTCPSSSMSALTENDGSTLKDERKKLLGHNSRESSLTLLGCGERNYIDNNESENRDCNEKRVGGLRNIDLNEYDSDLGAIGLESQWK